MLTFASAFASNLNIASTVMLMLMQRMDIEPFFAFVFCYHCFYYFRKYKHRRVMLSEWAFTISLMAYSDTACLGPGTILHQLKFSH